MVRTKEFMGLVVVVIGSYTDKVLVVVGVPRRDRRSSPFIAY